MYLVVQSSSDVPQTNFVVINVSRWRSSIHVPGWQTIAQRIRSKEGFGTTTRAREGRADALVLALHLQRRYVFGHYLWAGHFTTAESGRLAQTNARHERVRVAMRQTPAPLFAAVHQ